MTSETENANRLHGQDSASLLPGNSSADGFAKRHRKNKTCIPGETVDSRKAFIDVLCTDADDGSLFICEMQNNRQTYFRERMVYYSSKVISTILGEKGDLRYNKDMMLKQDILNSRRQAVALNLKAMGLSPKDIAKATGLTAEELQQATAK